MVKYLVIGVISLLIGAGLGLGFLAVRPKGAAPLAAVESAGRALSPLANQDSEAQDLKSAQFTTSGWRTDFGRHSVPYGEIFGAIPKDAIPAVDDPKFLAPREANTWLKDREPVVSLEVGGHARAYPLQVLIFHEIVNDVIGQTPVLVTFCPLCNTAIAFERRVDGVSYDFGTTGNLRYSDLVMYDRQTESWWQQITGEAIMGELTGKKLRPFPASIISWKDFKAAYPQGQVLSRDTGYYRPYGNNPYVGYDDIDQRPFLYAGTYDGRLRPMERVVTVSRDDAAIAFPFTLLKEQQVVHHRIGQQPLVVFYAPGTASALDAGSIADSRDIGATGVFEPIMDGRGLTFRVEGDRIVDQETGSTWNILGQAVAGPLAGKQLTPVIHGNHFWFAWAAFRPDTQVYQPR